ncbi:MAG: type ISP restriction/modification enzyme [Myxococcota bacterium]
MTVVDPACGPGGFLAACLSLDLSGGGTLVGMDRDRDALRRAAEVLGPVAHAKGWSLRLDGGDTLAALPDLGGAVTVLGNPPWAGRSASRTELSETLLDDFRRDEHGSPLRERKIGVLSDAYVRFWRWAAEVVRRAPGGGIVGLVTNASFLDGPVHRGMRAALARWFDRVDVVDLGGSALVAQAERDENVFGVRPSVAITIALRGPGRNEAQPGVVRVMALRGTKEAKLRALDAPSGFRAVDANGPWRLAPLGSVRHYPEGWVPLSELIPFHREGVQTNRDAVVVGERETLEARVQSFVLGLRRPDLEAAFSSSRHFDPERARKALLKALRQRPSEVIRPLAYRPWDRRHFIAISPLCHRPRPKLLTAMDHSDFALLTVRKDRGEKPWRHVAVSTAVPDNCFLSARSSCRTRAFPTHDASGAPNLSAIGHQWIEGSEPNSLHYYVLAILASSTYQRRYGWLLHQDYPAIPPPPDHETLQRVAALGRQLAGFYGFDGEREDEGVVGHWTLALPAGMTEVLTRIDNEVVHV